MTDSLYRFGLLCAVCGGFLSLNSTGLFASVGLWVVLLGFLVGAIGLVQPPPRGG